MRRILLVILILFVAAGAAGCIKIQKKQAAVVNLGGVFLTADRFETWQHSSLLMTPGEMPGSIGNSDIYFMKFDPSDSDAIYAGTRADGLYYSYNGGAGWNQAKTLPQGFIRDLAIDNKSHCVLYAAVENRIYKSLDCARTWKSVWTADNDATKVTAIDIDWYEAKIIYAGLTDGSLMKSDNSGSSWKVSKKFDMRVNKIIVDPNDSRIVYAGVIDKGIYKTADKGAKWESLNKGMKDMKESNVYYDFDVSKSTKNMIVYASKFGLLKSLDGGTTWTQIKLLTQPGAEIIFSLALDPNNASYIYYGTDKVLYKTLDGGASWVVKKMPTSRVAGEIRVHPKKGNVIFLGAKTFEQ